MLEFKSQMFTYKFTGHVNLITGIDRFGGDSGRGKTSFFTMLYDSYTQGELVSNKDLVFIDRITIVQNIQVSERNCVICDETNISSQKLEYLMQLTKQSNSYLLVFGRIDLPQLEFGAQDVYFVDSRYPFGLKPVFECIKDPLSVQADVVVTEDSWSVAGLLTAILGTNVVSAGSKNNIWKKIKGFKYPLIIADEHKFMPALMQIISRNRNAKKLYLFLPASFEEILLDCTTSVLYRDTAPLEEAFDGENYCESEIKQICSKFNKNKVSDAIRCLLFSDGCEECRFNLGQSGMLRGLLDFYSLNVVKDEVRKFCYEIDIEEFRNLYFNNSACTFKSSKPIGSVAAMSLF